MGETKRLQFGVTLPTLSPHLEESRTREYRSWVDSGCILYISPDGEEYATIPKDARVLLKSYLPESSRKRKRVPATIKQLLLNGVKVDELNVYGSQEVIINSGQTVYVPPNWFETSKPRQPKVTQAALRL